MSVNPIQFTKDRLTDINNENFNEYALEIFRFQAKKNEIYKTYLKYLAIDPNKITKLESIPFLPIEFFKRFKIKSGMWREEKIFQSSGTTGMARSKHYIHDLSFYNFVSSSIFESMYGNIKEWEILALLPSYIERQDASLIYMVDHFIHKAKGEHSGYFLNDYSGLYQKLQYLRDQQIKTLLIGVSFALLDFIENFPITFPGLTVMETGGMKGRREEVTRMELHEKLKSGFGINEIHSEYGMTELMSQAYALGTGRFNLPPWMKIFIREINDPFQMSHVKKSGGINIIDLANIHSCAFIETKDIGKLYPEGSFEVLGRIDYSDIRGCNLLVF